MKPMAKNQARINQRYISTALLFVIGLTLMGASLIVADHSSAVFHPLTLLAVLESSICFMMALLLTICSSDRPAYRLPTPPRASHSHAS